MSRRTGQPVNTVTTNRDKSPMADINQSSWHESASANTATPPNGSPEGVAPAQINNIIRENMAALKRFWNQINGTLTATGTGNAIVLTYSVAPTSLTTGMRFSFFPASDNTSTATANINSLGAISILAYNAPLSGGEIQADTPAEIMYDGSNFHLLNPVPRNRTKLTANQIYYVDGDAGDDGADGSAGTPWATIQFACDYLNENVDAAGFSVTINQQGTDTTGLFLTSTPPNAASSVINLVLNGDVSTTGNAITCFRDGGLDISGNGSISTTGNYCLVSQNGGFVSIRGIEFLAADNAHIFSQIGGTVVVNGSYSIGGNAAHHWAVDSGGSITVSPLSGTATITLNGTRAWSDTFASAATAGQITADDAVTAFSGSGTGSRYFAGFGGGIFVGGASTSFFPGSTAGSVDSATYGFYA